MASDTATLDLERIQAEARRQRSARPSGPLGPDDRAPADAGRVETDPATRAHLIVQEVLAAAAEPETTAGSGPEIPVSTDSAAAAHARRIVEEVLATAKAAAPVGRTDVEETEDDVVRADLVLLGIDQPTVLVPSEAYEATPAAFAPPRRPALGALVDAAIAPLRARPAEARTYVEADDTVASQDLRSAIEKAASSESMHLTRWVVAAAVWAVAFALVVPLLVNGLIASVDMTVDLWGDQQPAQVTSDQAPASSTGDRVAP